MHFLLASIASSVLILSLFRLMQKQAVVTRHAILCSYLASALTGLIFFQIQWRELPLSWYPIALIEGLVFYLVFRLMGLSAQTNGIAVASIATKMSVVIPVAIGLLALGETISLLKIIGIIAGVLAVVLVAGDRLAIDSWTLPLLVFVSTGLVDASFKLFQVWGLSEGMFPGFIVAVFASAFLAGIAHHMSFTGRAINLPSTGFGVLLGLANFGTVYFIMKALAQPGWESSIVYPLNHFGVVAVSTVIAITLFKERPGVLAWSGLALAFASIALLYGSSI